jgi:hydroxymethylbilane synthase
MKFRIGTRKSALAKVQSLWVKDQLELHGISCELVEIESEGDKKTDQPLYEIETTPGIFTKQLEVALEKNLIDLAVHSLKDLPTEQPKGLRLSAVTKRVGESDKLLIHPSFYDEKKPLGLKSGAKVGTSSLRREAQMLELQQDIQIVPVRGNVPTRVKSVSDRKIDAVVLAEAGLARLGLFPDDLVIRDLTPDLFVPAPGQGALAIETRESIPDELSQALKSLHDPQSETETRVERAILRGLHGGCTLPLGVRCRKEGNTLKVKAFLGVASTRKGPDRKWLRFERFDISDAVEQVVISQTVQYLKPHVEEGNGKVL